MSPQTQSQNLELQIRRTLDAPRQTVFDAWTDPKQMKQWFRPSNEHRTLSTDVDLRAGGRYRIQMQNPAGQVHTIGGEFREVSPPKKLVYTWKWEEPMIANEPGWDADTLITVEFHDLGEKTEVVLTHQRFPTEKSAQMHNHGWNGCLDMLTRHLAK